MKKGVTLLIAIVVLITISAWTTRQTNDFDKATWLVGTWENKTTRGSIYETWNKVNENEFSGKSYILKDKDTVVFETIQLVHEEDGLFYIPTVKNQNEGLPVRFKNISISETQMVFENLKHDFPQKIAYTKISADSLVAEISGTQNGQERKQAFPMKRVE